MSAIVDILNGALETEAELAAARAGLTLPLIKVAITEYLAEEKGVASWTKLAGVVVARDKSLKAVIAIVDENAAAAKFDDREAQNRMAAAFGTVGTLACIRSWALWSIEEAEQDAAALFGSFYDHDSELVDDLKEAVNYPLDLLRNNIVARAAATCGEITNLLGQYNSSKNKNALGVYRVGLETTFGSLKHYCVSEVALAKEKVRLYFENMALGYVSVGRPDHPSNPFETLLDCKRAQNVNDLLAINARTNADAADSSSADTAKVSARNEDEQLSGGAHASASA